MVIFCCKIETGGGGQSILYKYMYKDSKFTETFDLTS